MNWFRNGVKAWGVVLASLVSIGATTPAWSQGFEDDFAQRWEYLEDDTTAIQQVGCFSSSSSDCCGSNCDSGCDSCRPARCCPPWWAHRSGAWGQWLYVRPGSTDLVYTIEQNDVGEDAFPTGPTGCTQLEYASGFRVGFSCALSQCASFIGSITDWKGKDESVIDATEGNVLVSEILHPSRFVTGGTSLQDAARHKIDFQLADLGFRRLWRYTEKSAINWRAGVQYANLDQEFGYAQLEAIAVGPYGVQTDIGFDGFGTFAGLDFERHNCNTGLSIYSKLTASALAGEWNAHYRDANLQTFGGSVANVYKDFRVTPMTEWELGFAWQNNCGNVRANVGYLSTAWYEAVSTRTYIDAVRQGRYIDIGETMTFSGLVVGAELRF